MSLLYDFHLHSNFSADCRTPAALIAERACALGLCGICFTEHFDLDAPDPEGLVFTFDTQACLSEINRLKELYRGRLEIFAGVEIGMQSHVLADAAQYAGAWPFDFIIASQHYVNGGDPYYPSYFEGREEHQCYEEFFGVQLANLQHFSSFQTLGHMDYVVRYGPSTNTQYSFASYADYIDPILRHLIEHGKCLEVNTGGFKYGLGQPNPDTTVLQRYRELGGELITIGSDAHSPEHLAYDFARAAELLTGLGFRYYAIFEKQRARMLRL